MKSLIAAGLLTGALLAATPALARDIQVEITNLTAGIYFTPLLVAAHDRHSHLFEPGTEASAELQALAEGGDSSGLIHFLEDIDSVYAANPASGLLPPGESATANLEVHGQRHSHLSIVAMLLPTNDGFVGLDALPIPHGRGSYTYFLKGYDAGTEANDEIINGGGAPGVPGIPADPGGNGGSGALGAAGPVENNRIHIHPGGLGDTDPLGGLSDLDSRIHRWLNPVARIVIHVN